MTKKKITLEVDTLALFDQLISVKGDTTALGVRLVNILFDDSPNLGLELGLAAYGISVSREDG